MHFCLFGFVLFLKFYLFIYLFIYLFRLRWVFMAVCRLSLVAASALLIEVASLFFIF